MKPCKQCGRSLPDADFREYYSRSKGVRKSSTGRNTVCKKCESFNAKINRIAKIECPTAKDLEQLDAARDVYRKLHEHGLEPVGSFAKQVIGEPSGEQEDIVDSYLAFTERLLEPAAGDYTGAMTRLLTQELVDEPDVYQDELDTLRVQMAGGENKRVPDVYKPLFDKVATRLDDYEDSYWETH